MTGDVDLAVLGAFHSVNTGLLGGSDDGERIDLFNVLAVDRGVTAVRCIEHVVKAAHQCVVLCFHGMREDTEHFLIERVFFDSVVMVMSRLRAPADVKRTVDVLFAPVHDFAEFVPVFHLFKFHLFDGRTCNDHTVKFLIADFIKGFIEHQKMLGGGVFGLMRCRLQKRQLHLQRRVAEQTRKLCFCDNLGRHQVQKNNAKRTDILRHGALFGHDKDLFRGKCPYGRQFVWYFDRHGMSIPFCYGDWRDMRQLKR